jgi:hypothetical protein
LDEDHATSVTVSVSVAVAVTVAVAVIRKGGRRAGECRDDHAENDCENWAMHLIPPW